MFYKKAIFYINQTDKFQLKDNSSSKEYFIILNLIILEKPWRTVKYSMFHAVLVEILIWIRNKVSHRSGFHISNLHLSTNRRLSNIYLHLSNRTSGWGQRKAFE